jgi:hypothetical protein
MRRGAVSKAITDTCLLCEVYSWYQRTREHHGLVEADPALVLSHLALGSQRGWLRLRHGGGVIEIASKALHEAYLACYPHHGSAAAVAQALRAQYPDKVDDISVAEMLAVARRALERGRPRPPTPEQEAPAPLNEHALFATAGSQSKTLGVFMSKRGDAVKPRPDEVNGELPLMAKASAPSLVIWIRFCRVGITTARISVL